jgi:hypothetical protein
MKIRFLKDKEIDGRLFKAGWVTSVEQATATAWIAAGDAESAPEDARCLQYEPDAPVLDQCIDPGDPGATASARARR